MTPLYNMFGGQPQQTLPGPIGNMQNVMSRFQQFRQQFSGDPKQQVQALLSSGRMTQQQLSQLQEIASQFQSLFGRP